MRRPWISSWPLLLIAVAPALAAKAPKAPPAPSLLEGVEIFSIDTPHSEVSFTVPWMGISRVRGTFQDFLGSIAFDSRDPTRSSVMVVIHAKSINTGWERRDKDLRGPSFFDVEKYPNITFVSRAVAKRGDGYVVNGSLAMHGATREIEIPMEFNGRVTDVGGDSRIGFQGHLTLKRKDYGIIGPAPMNRLLEKGLVIGEEVDIPLAIEGWKAAARDTMRDRTADSLYRAVMGRGVTAVARRFNEARATTPDSLMTVDEGVINAVGYQLIEKGRASEAAELFRLETESWPRNAFGYVGLGQAYAVLGNRDLAIAALEKAIAITPEAPRAQVILKRLRG